MPSHSKKIRRICETCQKEFFVYPSTIKYSQARVCSRPCRKQSLADRFFSHIGQKTSSGCILWGAATNKDGYGVVGSDGRSKGTNLLAHRVAYELMVQPIPDDLLVLHDCDNPPCINPTHLFIGTQADNIKDMVSKKRYRKRTHGSRRFLQDIRLGR